MTCVLIVDDSAVDRALVQGLLSKEPGWKIEQAHNGAQALEKMQSFRPHVVVTDLQMPEMDGLEFVTAARQSHGDVPVILMTAHGSEELALEALSRGAASFVPKPQLVDTLLATVKQVLSLAKAGRGHKQLLDCVQGAELTFALENDLELMHALVDFIQGLIDGAGLCDASCRVRIGMALEQALHNAVYWGNLEICADDIEDAREQLMFGNYVNLIEKRRGDESFRDRRVHVRAAINANEARFVIADQGKGFNVADYAAANRPGDLHNQAGRGLVLMRALMDEVTFNESGNEVTMIKRRESASSPSATSPSTGSPSIISPSAGSQT